MLRFQRTGDAKAARALYELHRDGVWQFLFRLCRSESNADDLAQKVWLRLLRVAQAGTYSDNPDTSFKTYLFTIAQNIFLDDYRSASHRYADRGGVDLDTLSDTSQPGADELIEKLSAGEKLLAYLRRIPVIQQQVLSLWAEGFSYDQIAAITGVSRATVIGRKRYGLKNLRRFYEGPASREGGDDDD